MGKLHITVSSIFVLTLLVIIGCRNEVTFETTVKEQTSTVFTTTQDATCVYYYKQNKYGDTDLTSYERDTSADATNVAIKKGTALSQVAQKNFAGFSYATAVQVNDVVNVYYNRNTITYEFYRSTESPTRIYKMSGLYGTDFEIPSFPTALLDSTQFFSHWATEEGGTPTNTYGSVSKKFYAEFLSGRGLLGSKGCVDTLGDILLDDGSVISYKEYVDLTEYTTPKRSEVIPRAVGVLFCTDYNLDYVVENWGRDSQGWCSISKLVTEGELHAGRQKLIAGVFKETGYSSIPWSAADSGITDGRLYLQNCVDGEKNIETIEAYLNPAVRGDSFKNSICVLTAGGRYGNDFCQDTIYSKNWYAPSICELYVLHRFLQEHKEIAEDFYGNFSETLWTSQACICDAAVYSIGKSDAYDGNRTYGQYAVLYAPRDSFNKTDVDYAVKIDFRSRSHRVIPVRKIY